MTYNNVKLKEKKEEKWLGDVISAFGNKASTLASIRERKGRLVNAIFETIAIIEDSRVNRLGAGNFAKDVWEMALILSFLNNAESWNVLDKEVQEELEGLQCLYFCSLLALPKSVPKPAICYEANLLQMKLRTFSRLLHEACLPPK